MTLLSRFLLHLRLPFNYVLSPLFLWGAVAADGRVDGRFWLGFVAFHLFLYGGTNMFNAYWDRDEGPIGGLAEPPPVDRALLVGSLLLKAAGVLLAVPLGVPFIACAALYVVYSLLYSHPAIRLKRRPLGSAGAVLVGQGVVGFLAGWLASGGELAAALSPIGVAGAGAGALLLGGLYPVTQVYQIEEDAVRGDLTLARWLGPPRVWIWVAAHLLPGIALAAFVFHARGSTWAAVLALCVFPPLALALAGVRRSLGSLEPRAIYARAMGLQYGNATALLALIAAHLGTR